MLQETFAPVKHMTFTPAQPDHKTTVGNTAVTVFSTPEHYVTVANGGNVRTEVFQSRFSAEHYAAGIVAAERGYAAFWKGNNTPPVLFDETLLAMWMEGWNQACAVGYGMVCDERDYDDAEYGIEDDYSWIQQGC